MGRRQPVCPACACRNGRIAPAMNGRITAQDRQKTHHHHDPHLFNVLSRTSPGDRGNHTTKRRPGPARTAAGTQPLRPW
jgi:hypothetical protein